MDRFMIFSCNCRRRNIANLSMCEYSRKRKNLPERNADLHSLPLVRLGGHPVVADTHVGEKRDPQIHRVFHLVAHDGCVILGE